MFQMQKTNYSSIQFRKTHRKDFSLSLNTEYMSELSVFLVGQFTFFFSLPRLPIYSFTHLTQLWQNRGLSPQFCLSTYYVYWQLCIINNVWWIYINIELLMRIENSELCVLNNIYISPRRKRRK